MPDSRFAEHCRGKKMLALTALALALGTAALAGCHRSVYRKKADRDAYQLIEQKVCHSGETSVPNLRIDVDPLSRMFDPFDPDRPPMPEDDPKSHAYLHCVDGKRGYPLWHANGNTNTAENPDWWRYLPLDERGVLVLDADTAVRLALLHSPAYQQQLETLYLSALDVSGQRFRFDTQFFGGYQTTYTADGRLRNGNGNSSSLLSLGAFDSPASPGTRPLAMQRTFATGADLVVGLANSIVWDLSGPNTQSATTILDFALVQPLLRGAGRDRVLAQLTFAERNLLANVRAFERFRRGFYLTVTTGRATEAGPVRSGTGNFVVQISGVGTGAANQGAGGFLGLLQDQLRIQNQKENVARLQDNLLLLDDTLRELLTTIPENQEDIPRQRLQVAQAQQALLSAQNQLVSAQGNYEASVDAFLVSLGLPPYVCAEIVDPLLDQFQLISPELKQLRRDASDLRVNVGNVNTRLLDLGEEVNDPKTNLPTLKIQWNEEVAKNVASLKAQLGPIGRLQSKMSEAEMPKLEADIAHLEQSLAERERLSRRLLEVYRKEKDSICTLVPVSTISESIFETENVKATIQELSADYQKLEVRFEENRMALATVQKAIDELLQADGDLNDEDQSTRLKKGAILAVQDLIAEMAEDVLAMQLIQARARTESVLLPEVDLSPAEALEIARVNRRDWANNRAALVEAWTDIEFDADDLESSLDIVFNGDIRNAGSNPFKLRPEAGRLQVGLRWDAPLTRLLERNTYREELIEYQQLRRAFYGYEDGVWQLLRAQLRQLRTNQINFELQRSAVRMAAQQISLNEDIRLLREARGLSSGPTAARDTISALNDLLNAQNGFLAIWVNYEVVRRNLNLDLGTMELTPDGYWIDPIAIRGNTSGGVILEGAGDDAIRIESEGSEIAIPPLAPLVPIEVAPAPRAQLPSSIRAVSHEAVEEKIAAEEKTAAEEDSAAPANPAQIRF